MSEIGNKAVMAANIKKHLQLRGMNRQELADAVGAPYSTVCEWVSGNAYPRIDKIEKMANLFGVAKSDLIEIKFAAPEWSDEQAKENHDIFMGLTKNQRAEALRFLRFLANSKESD